MQPTVKMGLREIWQADTRAKAVLAMDTFARKYHDNYKKAVLCLTNDKEPWLTFYDFPGEHWDHLRSRNSIGSVFAVVRDRTLRTHGALLQITAQLIVFKLVQTAAISGASLKIPQPLTSVIKDVAL